MENNFIALDASKDSSRSHSRHNELPSYNEIEMTRSHADLPAGGHGHEYYAEYAIASPDVNWYVKFCTYKASVYLNLNLKI